MTALGLGRAKTLWRDAWEREASSVCSSAHSFCRIGHFIISERPWRVVLLVTGGGSFSFDDLCPHRRDQPRHLGEGPEPARARSDARVLGETRLRGKFLCYQGKQQGIFTKIGPFGKKAAPQNAANSVSCRTIPYKMKQGINSRRTGNFLIRAGSLLHLAGNWPPVSRSFLHRGCGHGLILSCSSENQRRQTPGCGVRTVAGSREAVFPTSYISVI
jgi:hypothetical protein